MIDITQQHSVDVKQLALKYGAAALILSIFVLVIGPTLAAGAMLFGWRRLSNTAKKLTSKDEADAFWLKTLEHYGLIRLLTNDQLELVN
ncbi:unnamed protein product [Rotaria sp. Silwood1]|nr:unnamed protein product [Rotaria sp. Silwood1]CAF3612248.1 unnamed protein product [Rotaria sp. Silwood1]CAF3614171.1 unnamed protein product [Rotaria sp. Silwood1]CAF3713672.1 unnamed protein product [Rotaria sp. Silwood1]CAF4962229.1 unnamed protein product [Rotaria sp. Silwood1]